jgi:alanine dehydrogenase
MERSDRHPWRGRNAVQIAIPRERKREEYRVGMTPAGVSELVRRGHTVTVEAGAGEGSALPDAEYAAAGATLLADPDELWGGADIVCKVKEPVADEYPRLRPGLVLFAYLHLAADRRLTEALLAARVTAIAFETVSAPDGSLPLLAPMSQIAGRMAPQVGATTLQRPHGGRGVLLGGVPGVAPGHVVVLGAGVSGMNAVARAVGLGARVTVLDIDTAKLRRADERYAGRVETVASNPYAVRQAVRTADLVVGAVLVPGALAPEVLDEAAVATMPAGAVVVDIAVDQGGCVAGTRPTTHDAPTFTVGDTVFYCVANMPGAVPHTATQALAAATLRPLAALADQGWRAALLADPHLAAGLNTADGRVTNAAVAAAHGLPATPVTELLAA